MVAFVAAPVALLPGLAAFASGPSADERDASAFVTDGPVYAVAHQPGGNTYIGGDFDHVGPRSGHGLALGAVGSVDEAAALADRPRPGEAGFPEVAGGEVHAAVSDGHGGWFIGGDFTSVGGHEIPRLAHIFRPDHPDTPGEVDTSWAPKPDDTVRALALDSFSDYPDRTGEWTLYVGGDFQNLESTEIFQRSNRDFLAAWRVNATDGAPATPGSNPADPPNDFDNDEPLDWNPGRNTDNSVRALAVTTVEYHVTVDGDTVPTPTPIVIAGGDFTSIGEGTPVTSNQLVGIWGEAADDKDGVTREGQALPSPAHNASVRAITAGSSKLAGADGSKTEAVDVYVGGDFTGTGPRLRALQLKVQVDNAATAGNASFATYSGWTLSAADAPNAPVRALSLDEGGAKDAGPDTLYVGGDFSAIRGESGSALALEAIPDEWVNTSPLCNSDQCPSTLKAWDPDPAGRVRSLAVLDGGSSVYAGGDFSAIDAPPGLGVPQVARNAMAALVAADLPDAGSALLAWDARAAGGSTRALALDGDSLYAGGGFFSVGAEERANLAALDPRGGLSHQLTLGTSCVPVGNETSCSDEVEALELSPDGGRLYVGGGFTKLGPEGARLDRCHLGAVDLATEQVADWDPSPNRAADGSEDDPPHRDTGDVMSLEVAGERLYVGGHFDRIGPRSAVGGKEEPCDPPDPGQAERAGIAALDRETAEPLQWDPDPKRLGPGGEEPFNVYDIGASCDTVYAGGSFNRIGAVGSGSSQPTRTSIAELDPNSAAATSWNPNPGDHPGAVRTLAVHGGVVYAGGNFSNMGVTSDGGTAVRRRIAAVGRIDARATSWNPDADQTVRALAVGTDGETVYAGGSFNQIGGAPRARLAALAANGVGNGFGDALAWDPSAFNQDPSQSAVHALAAAGANGPQAADNVYAGGEFTDIGTSAQRGYAQFSGAAESPATEPGACESSSSTSPPAQVEFPLADTDTSPPQLGQPFVADGGRTLVFSLSEPGAVHVDLTGRISGVRLPKAGPSKRKRHRSGGKRRSSRRKRGTSSARCAPRTPRNMALLRRQLRKKLGKKRWTKMPRRKRAKRVRKLIAKRACTAVLPARSIDAAGAHGVNRISLAAAGPLPPGFYRATITARDGAGNPAGPMSIDFEVTK